MRSRLTACGPAFALFVAGAAALGLGCARSEDGRVSAPQKPPAAVEAGPAPSVELDPHTRGWTLGKRYGYTLKFSTELSVAGAPKSFDFDLTGTAAVVPVSVTPESATLYVSIGDASVVSRIAATGGELEALAAQIRSAGAFFTLSGGLVREMRFPPGQSPMASSSYRQLASALQFAHAKAASKRYATEEYDASGQYLAEYELSAKSLHWSKKKQRYIGILGAQGAAAGQPIPIVPEVESQGELRLSEDGRPEHVKLTDHVRLKGGQMPVDSTVSVELTAAGEPPALAKEPDWNALLAAFQRVPADQPLGAAPSPDALDAARIGSLDFAKILAGLEAVAKAKEEVAKHEEAATDTDDDYVDDQERAGREQQLREESQLFFALSALFRQEPSAVREATRAIRAKSPAARNLMDALSSASSTEAQRALVQLSGDRSIDAELRSRAINALVRTPKPNEASAAALKALLVDDPFDQQALYGLGTYSRLLRDSGKTKQASELGRLLVSKLAQAKSPMDTVTVLRSIANSGYAEALARVLPYLGDDRTKVRVAAVRALQSMKSSQVDGILAAHMKTDAASDVRIAAMASAQVREPSAELSTALANAGTEATDSRVRFRAVELMVRWLPQRPELREVLKRVASNDAEPKVRNRANAAL